MEVLTSSRVIPQEVPPAVLDVLPRAWPYLPDGEALVARLRLKLGKFARDVAIVNMALAEALARAGDTRADAAFKAAVASAETSGACHLEPWHLLLPLSRNPDLKGWDALWARAFQTFCISPFWARRGLGALVPLLSARAKHALVAMAREDFPADLSEPLREHALALLATEVDDDDTLGVLLDKAGSAAEAGPAIAAAACAAKRRSEGEADALARMVGLG